MNPLLWYDYYVIENMKEFNFSRPLAQNFSLPIPAINRCFSSNKLEEIYERLESEESDWAKSTLSKLKQKSQLCLKLILASIRKAENMEWGECLKQDYRVACRRVHDKEFHRSLSEIFDKKNYAFNDWEYGVASAISDDQVNSYFQPLEEAVQSELQLDLKPSALYPVKFFYRKYSDVIRYYLNEENITDGRMRDIYQLEVRNFLLSVGVDYRRLNMDTAVLRQRLFQDEMKQQRCNYIFERIQCICMDPISIEYHQFSKMRHIDKFLSDKQQLRSLVETLTRQIFEGYFDRRMQNIADTGKLSYIDEKRRFFLALRNHILNSRMTEKV